MGVHLGRYRTVKSLRRGDIINIDVPYEENTRDYYNGYTAEQIRGHRFTNRWGESYKNRMVIFIGRDNDIVYYLPLTSQSSSEYDTYHQYPLKDNSMTPHKDPNLKSYVEMDSLRTLSIPVEKAVPYTGRLAKEDFHNVIHRLANKTLQLSSKRDARGYVPDYMVETFESELEQQGYVRHEREDRVLYIKENKSITRTKYGMVHYHVELSKQKVREMVSRREGHDIAKEIRRPRPQGRKAPHSVDNDFSNSIEQLSQKGGNYAYANSG